jgi:hypothetical protein
MHLLRSSVIVRHSPDVANKPEIWGRFGEFDPHFSATCVVPANANDPTVSLGPIFGVLNDKHLA